MYKSYNVALVRSNSIIVIVIIIIVAHKRGGYIHLHTIHNILPTAVVRRLCVPSCRLTYTHVSYALRCDL